MKTHTILVVAISLFFSSVAYAKSGLEKDLNIWMQEAGIPGISLAKVENGKITSNAAFGFRDIEQKLPVNNHTVFEAASLSKPVMAYIVGRLVDKKVLDFDTPLVDLLDYDRIDNKEYVKQITPRLVLSHQTGLPNWGGTPLTFNFEPGKRFNYSGEGYVFLQRAIEKKTGKSLQAIAEQEVFGPLGMNNSAFSFGNEHNFELSKAHNRMDKISPRDFPSDNAAASLHTTATDYAKFVLAFFEGDSLSINTRASLLSEQVKMPVSWSNSPDVALTDNLAWSMGWGVVSDKTAPVYWHWGDNGEFRAFVAYNVHTQQGLVYFANSQNGLAISQALYKSSISTVKPALDWLGYAQFDAEGYKESRLGFLAESQQQFSKALKYYRASLNAYADNNMVKNKVEWFGKYIQQIANPEQLSNAVANRLVGSYGARTVRNENGVLIYQREGNSPHKLVKVAENTFILPSVMNFRLEFVLPEAGKAEKIIGHYGDNYSDESLRTD